MGAALALPTGPVSATAGPRPLPHRHSLPTAALDSAPATVGGGRGQGEPGTGRGFFPSHGPVTVMVQLDRRPAVQSFVAARRRGGRAAATMAARDPRAALDQVASSVRSHFSSPGTRARALFTLHNVYAGIAVRTDASRIPALARIPGVAAVRPMPAKHLLNASSVPLIDAPSAWAGVDGDTGKGVRIGIIDTGIDYTHADFGGTGSRRAYEADHRVADSPTLNVPSGDFPSTKVVGGIDLVGDGYDASSSDAAVATPHPDPNPLDCNSHGTHVAGSAAGYGVTPAGATYTGGYDNLTGLSQDEYESRFRVGPGVAPEADLYAIRVFGCEGSTNVVSEALDWAADPNGDGNFDDHLDVVNMSLGSDYGVPDDPDSVASNNASLLGITVVAAEGNGGDLVAVGGSPGDASRVIGVAASQDALTVYDAMRVNAPAADAGDYAGQESVAYDWAGHAPTTGDVAAVDPTFDPNAPGAYDPDTMAATNADGCDPFTAAQAAAVAGKIAWEEWTDSDAIRRCGSAQRSANAKAAGAVGVVFSDDEDSFAAGITGDPDIPVFQIRKSSSDVLRPAAEAGTLNVTLTHDLHNSQQVNDQSAVDQVAPFSSRGIGDTGNLKPDVTAPGMTIFSAANGTGDEGMTDSGTSMATPHVTGVAALVKAAHPTWYPEQIKAAIMNTADHTVWSAPGQSGAAESPVRVGAGRVDAARAVSGNVLAYGFGDDGSVGISHGPVDVSPSKRVTVDKSFKVENDGDSDQTYDVSYRPANAGTDVPGVSIDAPATVTVPAHHTVTVPVSLTVDGPMLQRQIDSARSKVGPNGVTEFITEASGWLRLSQSGSEQLRLPVYAAPRPVSSMQAGATSVDFTSGPDAALPLSGESVDQGGFEGMVSGYALGATSPEKPACTSTTTDFSTCTAFPSDRAADLHYVGATSDADLYRKYDVDPTDGLTYFAVAAYGPWRAPAGYVEYDVNIDTNGDGKPEAILFNANDGADVELSALYDTSSESVVSAWYLNGSDGSIDSHAFNNNVMVLPVLTGDLAKYAPSGRVSYWVDAFSMETGQADESSVATFDFLHPALSVFDGPAYQDDPQQQCFFCGEQFFGDAPTSDSVPPLTVHRDASGYALAQPKGLLLVHPYNGLDGTAEVVPVAKSVPAVGLSFAHNPARYGRVRAIVTVTGTPGLSPTGEVQLVEGDTVLARAPLSDGTATLSAPRLAVGRHDLQAVYTGDADYATATSDKATLDVLRAVSSVSWTAHPTSSRHGQLVRFHVKVLVQPSSVSRAGDVVVRVNGRKFRTVSVGRWGNGQFSTRALPRGRDTIRLHYLRTSTVAGDRYVKHYRVR
jgi:subtilisin family serine protease